eukprot:184265_1
MNRNSNGQCQVCFSRKNDEIFVRCCMCGLGVHGTCYGCSFTSNTRIYSDWKCRYCHAICVGKANDYTDNINKTIKCRICNQSKFGALKSCGKKQGFAHLVCALWTPWTFIENSYNMAPIKGIEKCKKYKSAVKQLICSICRKSNATLKCRIKSCSKYYHPLCLIETYRNCMIETDAIIDSCQCKVYYAYCPSHRHAHQEWNHNEGRKKGKSREIVFIVPVNKKSTNINNNRQIINNDVRMNDADSDIIVLSDKSNANQKRLLEEFECASNDVNAVRSNSDNIQIESLPTPIPPPSTDRITPQPQIFPTFMYGDTSNTPMPEIPMDIASQWTERFQNNNLCISDRDSVYGFNNNLHLRDYSPLTMGNMGINIMNEMTPMFNNVNAFRDDSTDFHFDSYPKFNGFASNENNTTNVNTNIIIGDNDNNHNEDSSMYSVSKFDNNISKSNSLRAQSTNSTFGTMSINHSPQTINSHSTLSTPVNFNNGGVKFQFKDVIDVDLTTE